MTHSKLFLIAILNLVIFQCKTNSNRVSIEITQTAETAGLTMYYLIDDKSINVDADCNLQDCKRKNVYKRNLLPKESDSLYNLLQSLQLDTLKRSYQPKGMVSDGFYISIKIEGTGLPNKKISIDNVDLPVIAKLSEIIDQLVLTKKYRFNKFGLE